jgi:hypothetical protein
VAALAPLAATTAASATAIGEGNGATAIAYEGSNHTLIFRWQAYGSTGWNREQVGGPGTAYSAPAVTEGGGATVIAYEGDDHSLMFQWQAYDTSSWNEEQVAGPGRAWSVPSILSAFDTNYIAVEGPHERLDLYSQAYGATPWNEEHVAANGADYSAPSLTSAIPTHASGVDDIFGSIDIVVEGPSHSLVDWYQPICVTRCIAGLGTGWHQTPLAALGTTYSAPAAISYAGSLTPVGAAYEGPQNSLQFSWSFIPPAGPVGLPGYPVTETVAGPGSTFSAPSIGIGNDVTSIAAQGPDHDLDFYVYTSGQWTWNEDSVSSDSAYSPPSIGEANGATSIVAEGPSHSLLFYWQDYSASSWAQEVAAPDGTTYT